MDAAPVAVLGAGYAGLSAANAIGKARRRRVAVTLIDRHDFHVLRTELFELGKIARDPANLAAWAVPLSKALIRHRVDAVQGEVEGIDLARKEVRVAGRSVPYRALVIALGSVPAYYGVPGAEQFTHQVYRFAGAQRLGEALRRLETESADWTDERRPRIAVVGGGSTGTEVAAEIATARWSRVVRRRARAPLVTMITGAVPFLDGLAPSLVAHARRLLTQAKVTLVEGVNVERIDAGTARLKDGTELGFDLAVWCAGVQAPPIVRTLPGRHGHAGRLEVTPELELPDWPGVFAVGDVMELRDPTSGVLVPATAQAALAEAPVAGRNVVARLEGRTLEPFRYRPKGTIVSVGVRRAVGDVAGIPIWGRTAAGVATLQQREYAYRARHRRTTSR
ncbi:MAG TPA: FAD-dependent oxidoreductase [Thermoplasmata archaeon]|nr:FAD-dependent oxidoreductase [Thermoplasmata archaeon]